MKDKLQALIEELGQRDCNTERQRADIEEAFRGVLAEEILDEDTGKGSILGYQLDIGDGLNNSVAITAGKIIAKLDVVYPGCKSKEYLFVADCKRRY